jgi:VWFA-related protein
MFLSALLFVAGGSSLAAQSSPETPLPETYSEQIEVRVVEVEVTVRDRDGLPVTGLGKSDFRLLVDGRPVAIEYFSEFRPQPSPEADGPSTAGDDSAVQALPVNVLIYIDEEYSLEIDLERVLAGLERQLAELRPQDRVAIVAWDGHRVEKLLDWTAPGEAVSAQLAAARARRAWGLITRLDEYGQRAPFLASGSGYNRSFSEATFDVVRWNCSGHQAQMSASCAAAASAAGRAADRMGILEIENRIDRTARAVAAATRSFRAPEGRRILALLSGGWATGWYDQGYGMYSSWDPVLDVADELRYSIYAVDVPGMSNVFLADASRRYDEPRFDFVETPAHQTLRYLAEVTGGEALIHGERRHVFARVAREATSYYSLAFTAKLARDDASHRIGVEVLHPDLDVRNRRSYRDLSTSTELDYALEAALLDGTAGGERTLSASLGVPVREKLGRMIVPLRVELEEGRSPDEVPSRSLELRVAAVDQDGRRVLVGPVPVAADAAGAIELPLRLRRTSHDLAVSLHDRASGESRTANLRLDP